MNTACFCDPALIGSSVNGRQRLLVSTVRGPRNYGVGATRNCL
jgi:hypothetical protein